MASLDLDVEKIIRIYHYKDDRVKLEKKLEKSLEKSNVESNIDSISKFLYDNSIFDFDSVRYVLDKYKITEDKQKFDELIETLRLYALTKTRDKYTDLHEFYDGKRDWLIDKLKKVLGFRFEGIDDKEKIIDFLIEEKNDIRYIYSFNSSRNYMSAVYFNIVPYEFQNNVDFIMSLLDKFPTALPFLYKYIDKKDIYTVLDKYYKDAYICCKYCLNKEELNYVVRKVKEDGSIHLIGDRVEYGNPLQSSLLSVNSNIIEKLRKKFGNKYEKFANKKGINPGNDTLFLKTMLSSYVLREIYSDGDFNNEDIIAVRAIINNFEKEGIDCTKYKKLDEKYRREVAEREIGICNYLQLNKDNSEKIDELLDLLHVNKDNFRKYIEERKFMDKNLKESSLLILSKHFKVDYTSISYIIEILQEMSERNMNIEEILLEKNISKKRFYNIYEDLKEKNPVIYGLIKKALSSNSERGFDKLLKLYHSIADGKVTDYNNFIEKYGLTPEEELKRFKGSVFYDDLYKEISKWYKFDKSLKKVEETSEIIVPKGK